MNLPDPKLAERFEYTEAEFDSNTGIARLVYRFDDGPELVETLHFPNAPWPRDRACRTAFYKALELLHLVAGVSYYKAGLSRGMRVNYSGVSAETLRFMASLYEQGLAEFAYRNEVDVAQRIDFPKGDSRPPQAVGLDLPDRALVAMGGGKDSLVGLELMQQAGVECMPVCVGTSGLIRRTVEATGLPLLQIDRTLAPQLGAMNRAGAWNGHVPVTAINSAILLCAAILYGYRYIVFSNERSADEATLITREGVAVNHQYSKSSVFEADFRRVIAATVSPNVAYFSILRPFSEIGIVRKFSKMKGYHEIYSSCNRNFHLDGPRVQGRWCLDCPKCRFAALCLAVFLPPAEVSRIMGGDLLNEPAQADGFRALCMLGRDKPFECVGEAGESRAALMALVRDRSWSGHAVVRALAPDLEGLEVPSLDELLEPAEKHFIPQSLRARISLDGKPDEPG